MNKRSVINVYRLLTSLFTSFLILFLFAPGVSAAPSGTADVETDNFLPLGGSDEVVIIFQNTAGADITDVSSTIQFITLAAANLNESRVVIKDTAEWEIWEPGSVSSYRVSGTATASVSSEIYSPYSTTQPVSVSTWALGRPDGASDLEVYTDNTQFASDLRILRPGEIIKLKITIECQNVVGDSRLWFFFRATEYEPSQFPVQAITTIPEGQRMNLYFQASALPNRPVGWWPLHNSYDPYDADINNGHAFEQVGTSPDYGWTEIPTTTRFAKSNKMVHQELPVEQPCISITKDGPAEALAGQTITYQFRVENCGNVDLTDVVVDDTILGDGIWSTSLLPVGGSETFTVDYTIQAGETGPLDNTAEATGGYNGQTVNDTDSHSVTIIPTPDPCISITKDGPAEALAGQTITYQFRVENCGNVDLTDVVVDDTILGDGIWSTSLLAVGGSETFTVDYTIQAGETGPLDNTAEATGSYDGQTVEDSDDHSLLLEVTPEPCISVTKQGPSKVRAGQTIVYHFVVRNCGNVALTNVVVNDPLLGGEIWSIPNLPVGRFFIFSVTYTVADDDPGPVLNTTVITGDYNGQTVEDSDDHRVTVETTYAFHICGTKFHDLDEDGEYDIDIEPGINGTWFTLLGPDGRTKAEDYYKFQFGYPVPETNPSISGENNLTGSYCFNLENVVGGTYTFFIKEEGMPGWKATTPTLIGPITLEASDDGLRESINNNFGNLRPTVVGVPALTVWASIGMVLLFGGVLSWVLIRRSRRNLARLN